jgi:hypothetical protein
LIIGRHIKAIGIGDPGRLRCASDIRGLLGDLVAALEMRSLGPPHIYEVEENIRLLDCEPFADEGGVTGIVVLSTSHCAIHTWPLRSQFVLDVFSCRKFDPAIVATLVRKTFETKWLRVSDLSQALNLEDGSDPVRTLDTASTSDAMWMDPAARRSKSLGRSCAASAEPAPVPAQPRRSD